MVKCATVLMLMLAGAIATPQRAEAQTTSPRNAALPQGLVYLRDVAPGIQQDIRYAGDNNFTGARLPGYDAGKMGTVTIFLGCHRSTRIG